MSKTATAAPKVAPQFFVVTVDGLGKWRKGDVVAGSTMKDAQCDIGRLLGLKAIRPATEAENDKSHIEIVTPERHMSYEQQLADKDKDIARLTTRVVSLEEQIAAGAHISKSNAAAPANESALIEEKDRAIRSLEARNNTLNQELATARASDSALRAELTALRAASAAAKHDAAADVVEAKGDKDKAKAEKAAKPADKPVEKPAEKQVEVPEVPGGLSRIKRMA